MINILIIGNGFDLAHNLPTRYSDYLRMNEYVDEYIDASIWHDGRPQEIGIFSSGINEYGAFYKFGSALGYERTKRFNTISKECFWIQHFLSEKDKLGDKWIDFETEIEYIITKLVSFFRQQTLISTKIVTSVPFESLNKYLNAHGMLGLISENDLFDILHNDYDKLIESLDLYMGYYVNNIDIDYKNPIFLKEFNHIISFNYTNTFERLYSSNGDCCYIHGKATRDRIVLGYQNYDESISKKQKEEILYQKYYQRIVNRTDNRYLDWLDDGLDFINIIVYGHSFSPADGDVLEAFITKPLTKTVVYCTDEKDRAEKIRNLAIIMGESLLQSKAGGRKPSIEFEIIENKELPEVSQIIR